MLCARCGELIDRDAAWVLDHRDDGTGYLGPSHLQCNRRAGGEKRNRNRVTTNGRVAPVVYKDDPAAGIFWGPEISPGVPRRWSRKW